MMPSKARRKEIKENNERKDNEGEGEARMFGQE